MADSSLATYSKICKVDRRRGIVIGYGLVCKERGADGEMHAYFDRDRHGPEHVTEDAAFDASLDFAKSDRVLGLMHEDEPGDMAKREIKRGTVVEQFFIDEDIAKSLGMTIERSGIIIGVKPDDPRVLDDFENGKLTGFSIRGDRISGDVQPVGADPVSGEWTEIDYAEGVAR